MFKHSASSFLLFLLCFSNLLIADEALKLYDLRCENLIHPIAIDTTRPHLSWKIRASYNGAEQTAYQIIAASDPALLDENKTDLWDSGRVESDRSVFVPYQGNVLNSRSSVWWKVRVWDDKRVSDWSESARFGVGLLEKSDWQASHITLPKHDDKDRAFLLRKRFSMDKISDRYLLHVNSLGYHEVWLNGRKVGENVLSPAVSSLNKRSMINSYDISASLKNGDNDLILWIGSGWYKPERFDGVRETPLVRAQLEVVDSKGFEIVLKTDETWQGRESEYCDTGNWRPWGFGGEVLDAKKRLTDLTTKTLDAVDWKPVKTVEQSNIEATPQMVQPNQVTQIFNYPEEIQKLEKGKYLVDFGKCLTGWTDIRFPDLPEGHEVILDYSDGRNKEGIVEQQGQIDRYIASGNGNEYFRNKFNYHGFRYIVISNLPKAISKDDVKAELIHTAFSEASSFECSDPEINVIHDMMQYTLKCLSIGGVFVDCPQFERLGYGGDGNSSLATASTMYDLSPLYYHWLQAWEDELRKDGSLPHVAPHPNHRPGGGPFWCGFIITAAWNNYREYGDDRAMRKHYDGMKRWLGYAEKHVVDGLLRKWPETDYRHWYLGDWATPKGIEQTHEKSIDLVNNCFMVRCYDEMSNIAAILKKQEESVAFKEKSSELKKIIHSIFFDAKENSYSTATQIDLVYPMLVGVTPNDLTEKVLERLFDVTKNRFNGHLSCGLVGLPVLAEWAAQTGQGDFMYSMLKKRDCPGFLYMLDNGATTTWEHWDAERSRIHNCYNALGPFFYESVGGLRQADNSVAYRHFYVDFNMPKNISWSKITKVTPYGTILLERNRQKKNWTTNLRIPIGSKGTFYCPPGVSSYVLNGRSFEMRDGERSVTLKSGNYVFEFDALE